MKSDTIRAQRSLLIKNKAKELGFDYCGISQAGFLEEEAPRLEQWLDQNRNGKMGWMENHFDKRLDPRLLVDGARSVISLLFNYFPEKELQLKEHKISKYAYGKDYHYVIKDKLKALLSYMQECVGEVQGRAFVDSAPVMDKAWAKKGGLGWVGKNTNLIAPGAGSFFFIAELIIDIDLEYDGPIKDYCGTCTRCIDACPTGALDRPYQIDASRCISYLTIELKENIPSEFKGKMDNWVFGCDVCQDVCPWNRFSKKHSEPAFKPADDLQKIKDEDLREITKELFDDLFRNSAVKRSKYEGFMRNISFIADNSELP